MLGEHPALYLPAGARAAKRNRGGGPSTVTVPDRQRQRVRLGPKFRRLAAALAQERVGLQEDAASTERDMVLVLEVATSVPEFYRAVGKVPGLEFLLGVGDVEQEQDEDFRLEKPDKLIGGALYMVFSDHRARRQLLSLWQQWEQSEKLPHGYGRFSTVFDHLRDIREWGPLDRIQETGLVNRWQEELQLYGTQPRRAEVELWFHANSDHRAQSERLVAEAVSQAGGQVISRYVLDRIRYHGMLVEVSSRAAQQVLDAPQQARLLKVGEMMFVRPLPQGFSVPTHAEGAEDLAATSPTRPDPIVGLIDGVPLANHPLLREHVTVHDPDELSARTPATRRAHGTAMASLIVHGDLSEPRPPLDSPIIARPVLECSAPGDREHFPEDQLPIDVVHRAITELVQGDDAAAPTVRIINLSLGDPAAVFHGPLSAWARLLDYLADRYDLLFIVSAGNHGETILLPRPEGPGTPGHQGELQRAAIERMRQLVRSRGLLAPAEAINVLTVGAVPTDGSVPREDDPRSDLIVSPDLPAPFSALGRGFRRSIKPDVLVEGGRLRYREQPTDAGDRVFTPELIPRQPPGVRIASPAAGTRTAGLRFDAGTSMAAAITTGEACRVWNAIDQLGPIPEWLDPGVRPVLVRALTVHAADWGDGLGQLAEALPEANPEEVKKLASLMLGYGRVRWPRLRQTDPSRVTLLAGGRLEEGHGAIHRVPLPDALNAVVGRHRVTTTLAWCSPVNTGDQRYRRAQLWTYADLGPLNLVSAGPDQHEVKRGTVEHIVRVGDRGATVTEANMSIHVSCAADGGRLERYVPYALVVSIEAAPELGLPIHAQVAARLRTMIRVPARTRLRP